MFSNMKSDTDDLRAPRIAAYEVRHRLVYGLNTLRTTAGKNARAIIENSEEKITLLFV